MAVSPDLLPGTCDVYRPFGAAVATYTNVRCRLVADFTRGRAAHGATPEWTHYLVLDPAADVLDGCTRFGASAVLTYADGDEVRVPTGATGPRFVVVWVETVDAGTAREFKRAYLLRHAA